MLKKSDLKRRDSYLNKLIAFRDTEPVKVITGVRRCGKSSLLKLMVNYLKDSGVDESQIIEMNFESFEFRRMTVEDFYFFVKGRVIANKKMYLFFDELQRLDGWEDAVNSFRVDFDCDIYITG
ncbi:MAG: AAA family ATPase, partial [Oscillospiraceae bacterium]|nr:AAA family ATPase [Oscillospiraceae bacterium]